MRPQVPDSLPGYVRIRPLGSGAFGSVFHETEVSTGMSVAVKYMHLYSTQLIARELRAMHTLKHPRIVQFYRALLHDDKLAVVMEFVSPPLSFESGANLLHFVNAQPSLGGTKRLTEHQARVTIFQVLDALSYIHSRSIVHRDLKCVACGDLCATLADTCIVCVVFGSGARTSCSSAYFPAKKSTAWYPL
jgi:calcium/calmodulin-dependent protein kinase I